jgi:hypothetical protein
MSFNALRSLIPITVALAMSGLACSSGDTAVDAETDNADLSATETNAHGFALNSHVLTSVPASAATASALGIATWDVFAGVDPEKKFSGSVFYASDKAGDVKFAFAVDEATKSVAFLVLNKDGSRASDAIDPASYLNLVDDVQLLTEKIKQASSWGDCATGIAVGGLALVGTALVVLGTPVGWYGLFIATGAALDAGIVGVPLATVLAYSLGAAATAGAYGVVAKLGSVVTSVPANCGL